MGATSFVWAWIRALLLLILLRLQRLLHQRLLLQEALLLHTIMISLPTSVEGRGKITPATDMTYKTKLAADRCMS